MSCLVKVVQIQDVLVYFIFPLVPVIQVIIPLFCPCMCSYWNFFYSVCWSSAVSLHLKYLASIRSSIQLYCKSWEETACSSSLQYRVHLSSESLATINCFTCSIKSRKQCNTGRKLRKETSKKFVCFIKITQQSGTPRAKRSGSYQTFTTFNRCTQMCQKNHHFWEASKASPEKCPPLSRA